MQRSATDAALQAIYSEEADLLRKQSRNWLIASQVFMLLAASPILLAFIGVFLSLFSGSSDTAGAGIMASMIGGVGFGFITMLLFCPPAFFCFYKFFRKRIAVNEIISREVRSAG